MSYRSSEALSQRRAYLEMYWKLCLLEDISNGRLVESRGWPKYPGNAVFSYIQAQLTIAPLDMG